MKTRETKTTIIMDNFANVENHATINDLMDKFYYCKAYTDFTANLTEKCATLRKLKIDIDLCVSKMEELNKQKGKSTFSTVDYSATMNELNEKLHGDGKKKGLIERRDNLIVSIETCEKNIDECVSEILSWTDKDKKEFVFDEETTTTEKVKYIVAYYQDILDTLHNVDYRTIEILSALSYNISVCDERAKTIKSDLETYYSVMVAHGYSVDGYKQCRPLADIKKRIHESVQGYLRSISIIYNEEGTSEGLFNPKVLNINATEIMLFIGAFYNGTRLNNKTGLENGTYKTKAGITGELINLALCKFQGLPYGKPADKKQK